MSRVGSRVEDQANTFITLRNGQLYLGDEVYRFCSLNSPELLSCDTDLSPDQVQFEVVDTLQSLALGFARPVTRTYTLTCCQSDSYNYNPVKSSNITRGHINGWNAQWGDWEWDEERLVEIDRVLDEARKRGVRLIIPLINQDYGGEDTNFVGNFTDLIRMRKGLTYSEAKTVDWWTDDEMIESFKLIIDKLLSRVNTFNHIVYGRDATILAFETGNEMNYRGNHPAPSSWTLAVARHLKSLSPALVMDGSFARTEPNSCYPQEVLESQDVDLLSYHYYGDGDADRVNADCMIARKYGKAFIAGEVGFFSSARRYAQFFSSLKSAGGVGALVWSLRPHSHSGGFKTHDENDGHYSYHIPGRSDSHSPGFDSREESIIDVIRRASYAINSEPLPKPPSPTPPTAIWISSAGSIMFRGSAWAKFYQLTIQNHSTGETFVREIIDSDDGIQVEQVKEGLKKGQEISVVMVGVSIDGRKGEESNSFVLRHS